MSQNQTVLNGAKSMLCIETPTTVASEQSLSFESFNSVDMVDESRPTVKSLVNKYGMIEEKLRNARSNTFDVKKKSFAAACKRLSATYKDCVNMQEGDTQRVESVETFVKNHVIEVFNTTTTTPNVIQNDNPPQDDQNTQENVQLLFKTDWPKLDRLLNDMGNDLWTHLASMLKANRDYYRCLTDIVDSRKFQNVKNIRAYVESELKKIGKLEYIDLGLTNKSFEKQLELFSSILKDEQMNVKVNSRMKILSYRTKMSVFRNELEEIKKKMRICGNRIKLLQKEKKDLLNILDSYKTENFHKVPLEKRLRSEQENHIKLQEMVSTIFENKVPFCMDREGSSKHSVCDNIIYDMD